jgi:hypothetical protein
MTARRAVDVLPGERDLPGAGWLAIDEGFGPTRADPDLSPGELIDCVGDGFPDDDEIVESAATPHYVRQPGRLLHGFSVLCASDVAADRAVAVLDSWRFADCLGRSVAADLADPSFEAELLEVDVDATEHGHRVRFTGGTIEGVRVVHLDVVCIRDERAVGVLWFADTPDPFPTEDIDAVVERIYAR